MREHDEKTKRHLAEDEVEEYIASPASPCSLSSAALKVWLECEKDTPFFCRRSIDKSCYEVGRQTNEDWRECISEDRIFIRTFATEEEAQSVYDEHRIKWMWSEILQANAVISGCKR